MDNSFEIKKIYFLLKGHVQAISNSKIFISQKIVNEINNLINSLQVLINEDLYNYKIDITDKWTENEYNHDTILWQIVPIITLLENMFINSSDYQIAKVGYLFNSIEDKELHDRCGDILLGEKAFDRAINQATQILENRIKVKAKLEKTTLTAMPLVAKAIHAKLDITILKFSNDEKIQEAYSNLFKGILGVYRNATHHSFDFICSREYALKFCAYVDELLKLIEKSEYIERIGNCN